MQTEELFKLVKKIQTQKCETQTIEVKAAGKSCPTRLFDTLSSFSNQDGGGNSGCRYIRATRLLQRCRQG
ncbi:MAG: ATP-binding protein [Oscillospiraceae bacterium]|nr:ATP-binding protein [Oscillospiraceae bacterium]